MSYTVFSNHFVVGYRISEVRSWYLHLLLLYRKSLVLRHSLVRFPPHLLMDKYHVLSMKYFVDVTLCIPKKRRIFYFYDHVNAFDCCLVTTRIAPHSTDRGRV